MGDLFDWHIGTVLTTLIFLALLRLLKPVPDSHADRARFTFSSAFATIALLYSDDPDPSIDGTVASKKRVFIEWAMEYFV